MLYFTFNDYPGGIYYSQVTDVIKYLNKSFSCNIKLIAFISLRNFFDNRKKIKSSYSSSLVLPMFPGVQNWRYNRIMVFFISLLFFRSVVICRGIFAFHIVYPFRKLGCFRRIVFDARGAYRAELEEYKVIQNKKVLYQIRELENKALQNSDFKIAVSRALINYWQEEYKYCKDDYVIIPCTLSEYFMKSFPDEDWIKNKKRREGFRDDDIIIVFLGSSAGWQSLKYSDDFFRYLLESNKRLKLLLLGQHSLEKYEVYKSFSDRVYQKSLEAKDVLNYLYIADYGWLVREESITNKVASPVKFAEYLAAGLKVLISENLGDYSAFCKYHQCGHVISTKDQLPELSSVPYSEKQTMYQLAMNHFTKNCYHKEYQSILNAVML